MTDLLTLASSQELPPSDTAWPIAESVAALRAIRLQSLESRQRLHRPPKLPSRKTLTQVVEQLTAALYPNRLGLPDLSDHSIDYFVGHSLERALLNLHQQIRLDLDVAPDDSASPAARDRQAQAITGAFAADLAGIRTLLDTDIEAAYAGDPAAQTLDEILVCYPGTTAIIHHRLAHRLYQLGARLVARIISEMAHAATGIDIHPGAQIGEAFFIDHGTGVVIGETAVIGRRVRLYQAVTLGAKRFDKDADGNLIKGQRRHPIVGDDVVIYAGATVLGRITIGEHSTIGGNVWLTHSVPAHSFISQAQSSSQPPSPL